MYLELLKAWLKETGLKEGGTVKVAFKPSPSKIFNSTVDWIPAMDAFVGKEFKVMFLDNTWIRLNWNNGTDLMKSWNFPFYCLEVIHTEEPKREPVMGDVIRGVHSGDAYLVISDNEIVYLERDLGEVEKTVQNLQEDGDWIFDDELRDKLIALVECSR